MGYIIFHLRILHTIPHTDKVEKKLHGILAKLFKNQNRKHVTCTEVLTAFSITLTFELRCILCALITYQMFLQLVQRPPLVNSVDWQC